jgi:3-deoxy-D-manno-octulosonate 8-phosphate phosphatase (KDO 8-P phosphatase)
MSGNGCSNNAGNPYPGDCEFTAFLRNKARNRSVDVARGDMWDACLGKAKDIKLLLLDVDGVLTDGSIIYTEKGEEIKSFNARDGFGINILKKSGVEVGIITARVSNALARRAKDLSVSRVYQGIRHKVQSFQKIIDDLGLQANEVAYMGDDWLDLPILKRVGLSAAVADATLEVRQIADYVAQMPGGRGAVREICDLIIEARGKKDELLNEYLNRT